MLLSCLRIIVAIVVIFTQNLVDLIFCLWIKRSKRSILSLIYWDTYISLKIQLQVIYWFSSWNIVCLYLVSGPIKLRRFGSCFVRIGILWLNRLLVGTSSLLEAFVQITFRVITTLINSSIKILPSFPVSLRWIWSCLSSGI